MKCDIFISYRRDGGDMTAMYIYQALKDRGYDVFYDLEVLRAGKFNDALLENIQSCKDFVLVLSPHALDRCSDERDWVRKEIAEALRCKKNIVPVMLNGFSFPEEMPEEIDAVRYQNGLTATTEYFMESVDRLCKRYLDSKPKKKKAGGAAIGIVISELVLGVAAGGFLLTRTGRQETQIAQQAAPTPEPQAVMAAAVATEQPTAVPTATPVQTTDAPAPTDAPEPTDAPAAAPTKLRHTDLPRVEENLLEEFDLSGEYELSPVFGNAQLQRRQIHSVTFLPTLENMGENAWDVSAEKNGSAMAWTTQNGDLYDLYIAGEGGVKLMGGTVFTGYTQAVSIDFGGCVDFSESGHMSSMFAECASLTHLDLSSLDTSAVIHMPYLFSGCSSLVSVNLTGMDTSRVRDMKNMFADCTSLKTLDLSSFDIQRVTDMGEMFMNCKSLEELDIAHFNTANVESMNGMFQDCFALRTLKLPKQFVGPAAKDIFDMFSNCMWLEELDVSGWDTSGVADMRSLFDGCNMLAKLDVSGWDTSCVVSMVGMFRQCERLTALDLSGWDVSKVGKCGEMFSGCTFLRELDLSGWNTENIWDMGGMFYGCMDLETLSLPAQFVGSSVTGTGAMFSKCYRLETLDTSAWDTSSVAEMEYMFSECRSLQPVDTSGWDLSSVENMENVFGGCEFCPEWAQ